MTGMTDTYSGKYFDFIRQGLEQMEVTDIHGNGMSPDRGFDLWAGRAEQIKQNTKGLLFFCGNGASASMAEHMSHDWFQNAMVNTTTCAEVSHITAISNDISYEEVFRYRVRRILSEKDMLVAVSSSGNSANIVNAVQAAKERMAFTVTVSGKESGNAIRRMGDLNFYVPLMHYGEVESAHALLLHGALDYYLDKYMGGRQ